VLDKPRWICKQCWGMADRPENAAHSAEIDTFSRR
jgi:hypothetical protein